MRRLWLVVAGILALGVHAAERDYVVYKASYTQVYDYHFEGGGWDPQPDKYAGFFVLEVTLDTTVTLERVLGLDYWTQEDGRYYNAWTTSWFRLVQFGRGQEAIVGLSSWKGDQTYTETMVVTGVSADGPPKGYAGVHFTLVSGSEIEREEIKMRLDTKLTAAARAAAAGTAGDPLVAIREVIAAYLESRGYVYAD